MSTNIRLINNQPDFYNYPLDNAKSIQFTTITLGNRLKSLGIVLLLDYLLLAVAAIGLGLMAFGTKKLKRIEEI